MTLIKGVSVSEVMQVLTFEWQTASLISLQIVARPESVSRQRIYVGNSGSAATSILGKTLANLRKQKDRVESRRNPRSELWEYRLKRKTKYDWTKIRGLVEAGLEIDLNQISSDRKQKRAYGKYLWRHGYRSIGNSIFRKQKQDE